MKYAVNLADLTCLRDDLLPLSLLIRPILSREVIRCEGPEKIDGMALLVATDVNTERMEAIVRIVREGLGNMKPIHKSQFRIYASKTGKGGWKRV